MRLTAREQEVACLVALGHTDREIASRLDISVNTARCHLRNIRDKLGVHSRVRLAFYLWNTLSKDSFTPIM